MDVGVEPTGAGVAEKTFAFLANFTAQLLSFQMQSCDFFLFFLNCRTVCPPVNDARVQTLVAKLFIRECEFHV